MGGSVATRPICPPPCTSECQRGEMTYRALLVVFVGGAAWYLVSLRQCLRTQDEAGHATVRTRPPVSCPAAPFLQSPYMSARLANAVLPAGINQEPPTISFLSTSISDQTQLLSTLHCFLAFIGVRRFGLDAGSMSLREFKGSPTGLLV